MVTLLKYLIWGLMRLKPISLKRTLIDILAHCCAHCCIMITHDNMFYFNWVGRAQDRLLRGNLDSPPPQQCVRKIYRLLKIVVIYYHVQATTNCKPFITFVYVSNIEVVLKTCKFTPIGQTFLKHWVIPEKTPPPTEEINDTPSPSPDILYKFKTFFRRFPPPWMAEISSVGGEWIFSGVTITGRGL